jgi:lycopene beta-cyclase
MSDTLDSAPFDYIIAGSGCAGLSLLYRILMEPSLQAKSILVIDREKKEIDDRTWCFWEKNDGLFQRIVEREWQMIGFKTDNYNRILDIFPYNTK